MPLHGTDLVATIALSLGAAFVGGFIARKVGLPSIVGYLLAGVVVGPFTPGVVADPDIALELAEIGVALLMFGVGLHFSVRDLLAVRRIAIPGALVQIATATGLGCVLGLGLGWDVVSGVVLGLGISVASTVVLLRALRQRGMVDSAEGRVAIGWLIVEDLFTVLVLVLLPILATATGAGGASEDATIGGIALSIGAAIGKAALLAVIMLVVGVRFLPWLLAHVEEVGSRELFTLAVVAIGLGVAFVATEIFDVSLALGAFLAGAVLSESHVSERAAADVLPITDIFTVLFFVSVGMLLDPGILVRDPLGIAGVLGVVVLGKGLAAVAIVSILGGGARTASTVALGLAQIGEFSFIVATTATGLDLLPEKGFQLVVAAALISVALNPILFRALEPLEHWIGARPALDAKRGS
jgi:CPA2 family monovalent cation:H+ antiporter-2